jgi:hypothetical protein
LTSLLTHSSGGKARAQEGLAAASVRTPTVAQYMLYCSYLLVADVANGSGPYREPLCHLLIVVFGNFPEKALCRASLSLTMGLTVGFGSVAAWNP